MKRLKLTLIGLASVGVILSQHMPLHAAESDLTANTAEKPVIALSQPIATTDSAEIYGANLNSSATKTTLADLMTGPSQKTSTDAEPRNTKNACFSQLASTGDPSSPHSAP